MCNTVTASEGETRASVSVAPTASSERHRPQAQMLRCSAFSSVKQVIFTLGTTYFLYSLLVTFQNPLKRRKNIWDANVDFWEALWNKLIGFVRTFGPASNLQYNMEIYGTLVVSFVAYWLFAAIYSSLGWIVKRETLQRYKIQPRANNEVNRKQLLKVAAQVVFNQVVVGYLTALIFYHISKWRGMSIDPKLPRLRNVLADMVVFLLVEEIGFYYSHRVLHYRSVYKFIHKQHHEWTAPIAVTAIYCHPIEYFASNLVPLMTGPLIMGSHLVTTWLWFIMATINTLNSHSGYHLPFLPSPEAHDFHHLKFNECYGVLGILDRLHGTNTVFRKSKAYDRHISSFSLTPVRERFPDDDKQL